MWASPTSRLDLSVPRLIGSRQIFSTSSLHCCNELDKVGKYCFPCTLDDVVRFENINKRIDRSRPPAWFTNQLAPDRILRIFLHTHVRVLGVKEEENVRGCVPSDIAERDTDTTRQILKLASNRDEHAHDFSLLVEC